METYKFHHKSLFLYVMGKFHLNLKNEAFRYKIFGQLLGFTEILEAENFYRSSFKVVAHACIAIVVLSNLH